MTTELEVLSLVSDRLSAHDLPYMLTGSFALAYYATPRMTRDLDIVVALDENDIDALVAAFESDFYIDADAARTAILGTIDLDYIRKWAPGLDVTTLLNELMQ